MDGLTIWMGRGTPSLRGVGQRSPIEFWCGALLKFFCISDVVAGRWVPRILQANECSTPPQRGDSTHPTLQSGKADCTSGRSVSRMGAMRSCARCC